jgi:N-acetyltransferase
MTEIWPPTVTLERDGIRLEPLALAHEAGLREAAADGELWRLRVTSVPEPEQTRAYIETALQGRAEGHRFAFAVIDIASGTLIGCTSYHDIVPAIKRVEIGYTWYRKSVQRSSVNTICKLMLMQHAFETLQSTVRDTVMYSMLASEWPEAKAKLESRLASGGFESKQREQTIRFVEVTSDNVIALHRLNAGAVGSRMVAPNAMSVAQGMLSPNAWLRGVCVGDLSVGLVMLFDPTLSPENAKKEELPFDALYVWRLMIDFKHQGKGYGEQVLRAVIAMARERATFKRVTLSYVMEDGSAKPFYEKLGFRETGKIDDGEMEMALELSSTAR